MAIAPITGMLKKKIITDVSTGFLVGGVMAAAYWHYERDYVVNQREKFYAKMKAEKEVEDSI
ncbi:Cytochrome c oxidase subunit 7A [Scheffersomyces spartinae]|uniref:Cytochrome c oxidase subunit 9, mitochondrial n=1 Tax=Scheffersomyces spartinae TaxID=45513 RepID=A0A9P7VC11_9ASCO|nr:Cytochrome c oxidase subunit 7A [Scheffersomyces spartinae]KAG7195263.1 Cytochrome c oxidase subunit 7A [Scheffersomyces spartinae]